MSRRTMVMALGLGMIASISLGVLVFEVLRTDGGHGQQKPAIQAKSTELKMDAATPVILEKEYLRSHKVLISDFEYKQDIIGNSLEQIQVKYTAANGFSVTFKDGSLVMHQIIDDWTPEDKAKCRIKEYRGMVAIYVGPDANNDSLQRVTAISFSTLPVNIREAIAQGKYEFSNMEATNDALENLDEYF